MSDLVTTILRTLVLDDSAFREWRERPNLFLRGIVLIAVVTLAAGLVTFTVDLVNNIKPLRLAHVEETIRQSMDRQRRLNPAFQIPEVQEQVEEMMQITIPMVSDILQIGVPLGREVSGFFAALGGYVSRVLGALGGWMFYGALVLIAVKVLGGTARIPEFLGMIALYVTPGLLGLLRPVTCLGPLLVVAGAIWSVVVYVKAVSVASDLDIGRSLLAVFAPFLVLAMLAGLFAILTVLWLVILIP